MKLSNGFTLFEVLIALTILSITMVASIITTDTVLEKTLYIEKKTLAHWVGMNVLNSVVLKIDGNSLEEAKTNGIATQRLQDFYWELTITNKKIDNDDTKELFSMDIKVYDVQSSGNKILLDTMTRDVAVVSQ